MKTHNSEFHDAYPQVSQNYVSLWPLEIMVRKSIMRDGSILDHLIFGRKKLRGTVFHSVFFFFKLYFIVENILIFLGILVHRALEMLIKNAFFVVFESYIDNQRKRSPTNTRRDIRTNADIFKCTATSKIRKPNEKTSQFSLQLFLSQQSVHFVNFLIILSCEYKWPHTDIIGKFSYQYLSIFI